VPARIELDTVFNLRDLGGYRTGAGATVRRGRVYRADGLYRLAGRDVDRVASLGLRTVVDLRTPAELDERGRFPVDAVPADYHHLPILERTWDPEALEVESPAVEFLSARYVDMLHEGRHAIAETLGLIADPACHPLVFHCAAGKDRTGVVAAVVLSLLGVDEETVAADYAASGDAMDRLTAWIQEHYPEGAERMARQPSIFMHAPAEAMTFFLDLVRARYGSIEVWARDEAGVDSGTVARLRGALLE
jgi:protein-tyrosine phosphatase